MSRYYRDRLAQINDSVRDGRILGTSIDWNKKSTVLKQVADELLLAGKAMATEQELTGETADRFMAERFMAERFNPDRFRPRTAAVFTSTAAGGAGRSGAGCCCCCGSRQPAAVTRRAMWVQAAYGRETRERQIMLPASTAEIVQRKVFEVTQGTSVNTSMVV